MKIKIPIWNGGLFTNGDIRDVDESSSPYTLNTRIDKGGTIRTRVTDKRLTTLADRIVSAGVNIRHPNLITNLTKSNDIHGSEIFLGDQEITFTNTPSVDGSGSGGSPEPENLPGDSISGADITNYVWITYDNKTKNIVLYNQNFEDVGLSKINGQWMYILKNINGIKNLPRMFVFGESVYISYGEEKLPDKINIYDRDIMYFGTIYQPFLDLINGDLSEDVQSYETDKLSNVWMDKQSPTIRNEYIKFVSAEMSNLTNDTDGFATDNKMAYKLAPIIDGTTEMPLYETEETLAVSSTANSHATPSGDYIQRPFNDPAQRFKNEIVLNADLTKFDPRITGVHIYRAENLDGGTNANATKYIYRNSDWRKIKTINFVVPTIMSNVRDQSYISLGNSIYIPPIDGLPQWRYSLNENALWHNGNGVATDGTTGYPHASDSNAFTSNAMFSLLISVQWQSHVNTSTPTRRMPLCYLKDLNGNNDNITMWYSNWFPERLHTDTYNYENEDFYNGQLLELQGSAGIGWEGFAYQGQNDAQESYIYNDPTEYYWFARYKNNTTSHGNFTTAQYATNPESDFSGVDHLPNTMVNPDPSIPTLPKSWTDDFCMHNGTLYYLSNSSYNNHKSINENLYKHNTSGRIPAHDNTGHRRYVKIPNAKIVMHLLPIEDIGNNILAPRIDTYAEMDANNQQLKYIDGTPIELEKCSFGTNVFMKRFGDSMRDNQYIERDLIVDSTAESVLISQVGYAQSPASNPDGSVLGNDNRCIIGHNGAKSNMILKYGIYNDTEDYRNICGILYDPQNFDGLLNINLSSPNTYKTSGTFLTTAIQALHLDYSFALASNGTSVDISFEDNNIPPLNTASVLKHKHIQTSYGCATYHGGRMFVGNVVLNADTDPETHRDMIIFSDIGSYDKLSPANYIQIKDSNSGTIQAMVSLGSSIAVFMENSIYNLHTPSVEPSSFRLMEAVDHLGLASHSIANTLNNLYFASHDGIYELNKGSFQLANISLPIRDQYIDVESKSKTQIAYHADNNSIMCIFGNNKNTIFEYQIDTKTWSLNTWKSAHLYPIDTSVEIPEDNHVGGDSPILLNSVNGEVVAIDNQAETQHTFYVDEAIEDSFYIPPTTEPVYPIIDLPDTDANDNQETN